MDGCVTDSKNEFLPRRVRDSLHADDTSLALYNCQFLKIVLPRAQWPAGGENATPENLLKRAALFVKRLEDAAGIVSTKQFSPDFRDPNGSCRFKRARNLIVAFSQDRRCGSGDATKTNETP